MSVSLKNLPKMSKLLADNKRTVKKPLKREESTKKSKSLLNLKYLFY